MPCGVFRFGRHYAAFRIHLAGGRRSVRHRARSQLQLPTVQRRVESLVGALTPEQRERAVDALFTVLHSNGATTFSEVMSNFPASIPSMLGAFVGLTPRGSAAFSRSSAHSDQAAHRQNTRQIRQRQGSGQTPTNQTAHPLPSRRTNPTINPQMSRDTSYSVQ